MLFRSAKDLTLPESALLAAIPNEPSLYDPYTGNHAALIKRQHLVLDRMAQQHYITQAQADEAKKVAILDEIKPVADQYIGAKAMHFVQYVRSQLEASLGKATVGKGGLQETVDMDEFSQAEQHYFAQLAEKIATAPEDADGAWFHQAIYEFKDVVGLPPRELFSSLYRLIIGKTSGPRAGWFLSILPRDWLLARLKGEK